MNRIFPENRISNFSLLLLLVVSCLTVKTFAQPVVRYSGPFKAANFKGKAEFDYRLMGGDTILDGSFSFQSVDLQALLKGQDTSFLVQGSFSEDIAVGDWLLQYGQFTSDSTSRVVDLQYRVNINGIQHKAIGQFNKGLLHGIWNYTIDSIRNSEVAESIYKSSIEFDNGIPQKSFQIEGQQYTMVGRCLRNGLAHDEWSLYSNEGTTTENWFFEAGVLKKIVRLEEGEQPLTIEYNEFQQQSDTVDLDRRYAVILHIQNSDKGYDLAEQSAMYSLLEENNTYYNQIGGILSALGSKEFPFTFKVLAEHHPLSLPEEIMLDSIKASYANAHEISETLLNDTQLNILKLSDTQAAFLFSVVQVIDSRFLQPLGTLVQFDDLAVLPYVSRPELMSYIWPDGLPPLTIDIDDSETGIRKTFLGPGGEEKIKTKDLSALVRLSKYADKSLDSIQNLLSEKLKIEKRQQVLVSLEEQLIVQDRELNQLIDSLLTTASPSEKKALEKIRNVKDQNLSDYASMPEGLEKREFAKMLPACHDEVKELALEIGNLPAQEQLIVETYQDAVWNPFVAVIMNEEVKKRITTAYRKVIVPFMLEQVRENLNCKNASDLVSLYRSVQKRMLEMREEDTARLERKLKKERDPEEILKLFEVELKDSE